MVVDKTYYERFPEIKKWVNGRAFEVLLIGASHGIGGNASENDIMPYYVLLTQTFGSYYKWAFIPNSYADNYARFGIEFSCEIRLRIF
jgi:hypothetical protein